MITTPIADGVVDVHAHWLPRELFDLPPGAPYGPMHDRGGELYLGELPLSIATDAMSDPAAAVLDMDRAGIGVRVLSAPPFAFPLVPGPAAAHYAEAFNAALGEVVANSGGRLVGLGMVTLGDAGEATRQLETMAAIEGIGGVAIPPLVGNGSLDSDPLRHVLAEAARLGLAVLVHPMQLARPEWSNYYLANLIGNPVESATAIATLLLSGLVDELPGLRICFVHGGGCAPGLVGRWSHAWSARADVSSRAPRRPDEAFRDVYFDTVTHGQAQLALLTQLAGADKILCGSDYPFDMAESDPARFAVEHGPGADALHRAAQTYLAMRARRPAASAAS
ncbi:2-hydroxy-3-carboxy-6-oxo-7-methylocta-2,4-dienoa te decarboxylase [Mycolicibacterium anyangense]|uniref:2-hydroxy-3-carboxy-6-oxo-7-methylocta-2,4-dienoa te decarboxylase n=1 Tax=Mycolicibacterium anyangense TaxID=1431246 RepID=A0A6N4W862_9MYCO|nr:amidohydrolase family protein [Mycolicibacterium anyangense]BBZ76327.1 2-hydroxy-3-carboxy-6-oxo-7-methylocta-2,4-dienoa te decarboxylase [Mycolicibacterium anyangense]